MMPKQSPEVKAFLTEWYRTIGSLGGAAKSAAKAKASKKNGKKGGRPRKSAQSAP